jgi:hypothetical protein
VVWPWKRGGGRGDRALDRVGQQASGPGPSGEAPVGSSGSSTRAHGPPRPASGMVVSGLRAIPTGAASADRPAYDLAGVDPSGRPIEVAVLDRPGRTLLAFLAVDCFGCEPFWQSIGDPATLPARSDLARVVVTKGPGAVSSAAVDAAAADVSGVPIVMSDNAWLDYQVLAYPSFVLVDSPTGRVVGETVGIGWDDVRSMLEAAD